MHKMQNCILKFFSCNFFLYLLLDFLIELILFITELYKIKFYVVKFLEIYFELYMFN